mgnify:CR=1 FL=1
MLIWNTAHGLDPEAGFQIWKGWVFGDVLQALLVVASPTDAKALKLAPLDIAAQVERMRAALKPIARPMATATTATASPTVSHTRAPQTTRL